MKIPYVNLIKQYANEKKDLIKIFDKVLKSGSYVGGEFIKKFEKNVAKFCGAKYCCSFNSGTDALTFALHLSGVKKGDEVITTPNSFIASTSVIIHLGAKPVFVDVLDDQNINPELIEKKITSKTKAIMPVHLSGRVCQMDKIIKISKKRNIKIIEDSAQAIGSKYNKKFSGTFGDVGCFSAHPLKNLNAIGDSGFFITNSKNIFDLASDLKNHGMTNRNIVKNFGHVSRMDNLQAAILDYRLKKLPDVIKLRRKNADLYFKLINQNKVFIPKEKKEEFNTYHTFVIQVEKRDELKRYLKKFNIDTSIHYPIPIHLQPAAKILGYKKGDFLKTEEQSKKILTLPVNQYLTFEQIKFISEKINNFYS
jgi:dTDP-4-amino-4,6-dideoxygalactose transaminase